MNLNKKIAIICNNIEEWNQCQSILLQHDFIWCSNKTHLQSPNDIFDNPIFPLVLFVNTKYKNRISCDFIKRLNDENLKDTIIYTFITFQRQEKLQNLTQI